MDIKTTIKNKKVVAVIVVAVMFIIGVAIGVMNFSKPKITKLDENTFKNLIEATYDVAKQDVSLDGDKAVAKINIVGKDLSKDQMIALTKKIYETTASAQGKLVNVEVYFFDRDSKEFPGFYSEGLKNKSVINVEKGELKFFAYTTVPQIDKNINSAKDFIVNDIRVDEKSDTTYINLALNSKSTGEAVVAQVKGLTEMINSLNPDKKIKVAEYSVNPDEANGFAYNTNFDTVLATFEKTSLK